MTIEQFSTLNPGINEVALFLTGSDTIRAVNISNVDCDGTNIAETLKNLETVGLYINEVLYPLQVLVKGAKDGYYHYIVQDTSIPTLSAISEGACNYTFLNPSITLANFDKSDYNVLKNNATTSRTLSYIFDVDRTRQSIRPSNYEAIISGSALPAPFQELNYSSIGLTNSRYNGAKTSIDEYGIDAAKAVSLFECSVHSIAQSIGTICSQSNSDRTIEELLFSPNDQAQPQFTAGSTTDNKPQIRYKLLNKFVYSGSGINSADTTIELNGYVDIEAGDLLKITKLSTASSEIMLVNSVTTKTSSQTIFTATRGYRSDIYATNAAIAITSPNHCTFQLVLGDSIFKGDTNQLYRVTNQKVWLKDTKELYYVDSTGNLLFLLETCTV